MTTTQTYYYGTGKRKSAIARVRLYPGGTGAVVVNGKPVGNGAPGITTGKLSDAYWRKRSEGWAATPLADLLEPELPQAAGAD